MPQCLGTCETVDLGVVTEIEGEDLSYNGAINVNADGLYDICYTVNYDAPCVKSFDIGVANLPCTKKTVEVCGASGVVTIGGRVKLPRCSRIALQVTLPSCGAITINSITVTVRKVGCLLGNSNNCV